MVQSGRILKFDEVRGYGFIAPDAGGEDVFVHANDLLQDKTLFTPGTVVTFEVAEGERGFKAFAVQTADPHEWGRKTGGALPVSVPRAADDRDKDEACDFLSQEEFSHEVTEALLSAAPALTGDQIVRVRSCLTRLAMKHGWVEANDMQGR